MVATYTVRAWLLSLLAMRALGAVHELLHAAPSGWAHASNAVDPTPIVLSIGLQEQGLDQLESKLYAVSDPASPEYGNHMEGWEVDAMFAPSPEAAPAVVSWLKSHGVEKIHVDAGWVNFVTDVGIANKLLDTTFAHYERDGVRRLRTTAYSVPEDVAKHIDLISPTTFFGKTKPMLPTAHFVKNRKVQLERVSTSTINTSCAETITPTCLKELYNIGSYTPDPKAGSKIGFGSFLNSSARYVDLAQFETEFNIPSQNITTILLNGGVDDQVHGKFAEANLDVQYIMGISNPLPVTQFIVGGSPPFIPDLNEPTTNFNEPYLEYYQYLLSQPNSALPQVISHSYADDEESVPKKYARRVCNMMGKLGMRGISLLQASGDFGVGSGCKTNNGKNITRFVPQFPGTCPYITAVGGTQSISPEIAWRGSSGGFSDYFKQPKYQAGAVATYLDKYIPESVQKYYKPYANFKGRGFPDVSAHSENPSYTIMYNNTPSPIGGTSAACPVFAGIVALLNDALMRASKKPLGFLNPMLYDRGVGGFIDIVSGNSTGCNGIVPFATWNATIGWDPVTGLGVPDFGKLKSIILGT